jgi:hypothetical protein
MKNLMAKLEILSQLSVISLQPARLFGLKGDRTVGMGGHGWCAESLACFMLVLELS